MSLKKILNSQEIKTAAIASILIKFLSAFFALLNSVILARLLSVKDFGIYVLAFTTITILSIPVALGLPELLARYMSKYDLEKNLRAMKGLLIRANQIVLFTSVLAFIIAYILYLVWWKSFSINTVETFWYAFLLLPILVFGELRAASLRGLKFVILGQMPDTFLRNLFFSVPLIFGYLNNWDITPQAAMFTHAVAATLSFFIGMFFLQKKILFKLKKVRPDFRTRYWLHQAIPFTLTGTVQIIKVRSLVYILATFGGLEVVAIYDVASRGASLVSFTVDAINKAISPYISSAFENQNRKSLTRIIKKSSRLIFALSFPVAIVFVLGGEKLLSWLFGEEFSNSYIPLVILCIGHIVNTIVGPLQPIFNMTNNQKYLSKNQLIMMVLSLAISIPLISIYGATGAALAFSIILVAQNLVLFFYIKRKLKIDSSIF